MNKRTKKYKKAKTSTWTKTNNQKTKQTNKHTHTHKTHTHRIDKIESLKMQMMIKSWRDFWENDLKKYV